MTDNGTNGHSPNAFRLALRASEVAAALGISPRQFDNLRSAGRMIEPIKFGARCYRWPVDELRAYVAAGCPSVHLWNKRERQPVQ